MSKLGVRRRMLWAVTSGMVLLILAGGAFAWRQLQAPSTAIIKELPLSKTAAKTPAAMPDKTINDAYAQFAYPGAYQLTDQQTKTALHMYVLVRAGGLTGVSSRIGVTIDGQSAPLSTNSSYRARLADPSYHQASWQVDGETIQGFTKVTADSGFEATGFWQQGSKLATISLTSPQAAGDQQLKLSFQALLASWHWRQ